MGVLLKHEILCEECRARIAIKTDSDSKQVCEKCALGIPDPFIKEYKPGRNDPCICGSGKKYKRCCINGTI